MIDCHCHLESKDYDKDREQVIEKCKQQLKAVITCSAHPKDLDFTFSLVERHRNFIFASAGIHPEYIKEIREKDLESFFEKVKSNREKIVSLGEIGLDYFWTKESQLQEKQKEFFKRMLEFAREIKKPVTVHIRESCEDALKILEDYRPEKVHLHMFGCRKHLQEVLNANDWMISENTIILTSKDYKKVVRDTPLERLMLETDAPFLGVAGKRNEPTNVKAVAEKIAEIKKISPEEVDKITTENAIKFFELPVEP
jgi:TatD DNase family protein